MVQAYDSTRILVHDGWQEDVTGHTETVGTGERVQHRNAPHMEGLQSRQLWRCQLLQALLLTHHK